MRPSLVLPTIANLGVSPADGPERPPRRSRLGAVLLAGVFLSTLLGSVSTTVEARPEDEPLTPDVAFTGTLPYVESFEDGSTTGWTISGPGTAQVVQAINLDVDPPVNAIQAPDGDNLLLLCNGPGAQGNVDLGNLDGDPDNNSDNDRVVFSQTFDLEPFQVPAILSFDWNFLTAESDGSINPDPFDDFFSVRFAGESDLVTGSVPGGGPSPYPDVAVDGVKVVDPTTGCSFEWGQSGFQTYQRLITSDLPFTLEFTVADQGTGDFEIDSGLLIDHIRIEPEVDMLVTKEARPQIATAGEALFYDITVTNQGRGRATDVELTDFLPVDGAGQRVVTYVAADAPPSDDGRGGPLINPACREVSAPDSGVDQPGSNIVDCELGTFAPGQSKTFTIQVEVHEDGVVRGLETLENRVEVRSFELDSDLSNNSFVEVSFLDDLADLRVLKVSKPDDAIRAGEIYTYTILVENLGPSMARRVAISDTMLASGTFQLVAPILDDPARAADSCQLVAAPAPQSGQIISCLLGEPLETVGSDIGTGRWTLQMQVTAAETQDIDNEVRVFTIDDLPNADPGTPDPDPTNNVAYDEISILDTSDLLLTKTTSGIVHSPDDCAVFGPALDQVTAGAVITWDLEVTNQTVTLGQPGGSTATNVVIRDFVPAGVEILGVTSSPNLGCAAGTPGLATDPAFCKVGTLAAGASATMQITALVDPGYVGLSDSNLLLNAASASSDNIDPDLSDNLASTTSRVTEVADLTIRKVARPDPVLAGRSLSYELVVSNRGPSDSRNVLVRDQLPPEVIFRSARIEQMAGRENCTYNAGAHEVVCSLLDLPAGEPPVGQRRIFINTTVAPETMVDTITNRATVGSQQTPDCNLDNNVVTVDTTVDMLADLVIRKDSEPTKVFAGEQKRYHIEVENRGPSIAKDVVVYDVLPDEVEYEIDTNDPMCTQPETLIAWRAILAGQNEVPPVVTNAMGLATFVLDTASGELTYSVQLADIDDLEGAAGIHIHQGPAGVNGPILVFLDDGLPPTASPTEPLVGRITLTPAQIAAISANPAGFYVNVHTTAFPGGEIRGQLADTVNVPLRCELGTIETLPEPGPYRHRDDETGRRWFDIWARVRPETFAGTTITNVAIVWSDTTPDPDTTSNVDSSKNLVLSKADLKVVKFGKNDGEVRAGEILTYTVMVDNLGPSYAEDVSLKDLLQAGEQFDLIDIVSDRDAVCVTLANGSTVTTTLTAAPWPPALPPAPPFGVLPPTGIEGIDERLEVDCTLLDGDDPATADDNEAQLAVLAADGPPNSGRWILTMRVRARQAQSINNIADVLHTGEEFRLDNNHAEVRHEITDVADLRITKQATGEIQVDGQPGSIYDTTSPAPPFPEAPRYTTSPSQVTAGRRISYTLRIDNLGPSDAENVLITDRLPPGVVLVPGTLQVIVDAPVGPLPAGVCETGTPGAPLDRLVCGLGTLQGVNVGRPDQQRGATIHFQVMVLSDLPPGAVLENDANVVSDVFDPFNSNDHAHVQTAVVTAADLATAKTSMGQNVVGYDESLQRFVYEDQPGSVTAGLVLRYELTVQNGGPSLSRNVTVTDTLPAGLTFLEAEGADCRPGAVDRQLLFCSVGDLPIGARRTFDIYARVDPAVPEGTVLTNCVEALHAAATPPGQPPAPPGPPPVLPSTLDPFPGDNIACTDTTVHAVADIGGAGGEEAEDFISKRDLPAEARFDRPFEPDWAMAGEEHRYRIDFGNAGPSTAVDVGLLDRLDFKQLGIPGEQFVRCEPLDPDDLVTCSYDAATHSVTVESLLVQNEAIIPAAGAGTLQPGLSYGFYLVTRVDPGYVLDADNAMPTAENSEPGLIARNTVRISSSTTDFRTANDVDTERTRIIAEADLSLEKTDVFGDPAVDPDNYFLFCDPVVPGGMITYDLTVTNDGPSDAADVYVVDWLPDAVVQDPAQVMIDIVDGAGEVIEIRDDGRLTIRVGNDPNNEGNPELGRVNAGSSVMLRVRVMVRLDAECGSQAVNHALVETRENAIDWPPAVTGPPEGPSAVSPTTPRTPTRDPDGSNNVASEATTIECPSIEVNKTISFDGQCPGRDVTVINRPGQPVTFCYEITNTGTTYLDTIMVTDTLRTRTTMPTIIFTDTITAGADPKVPVAPGETVLRQVTVPHLTKECGIATDTVEVSANPVNSGRTDLPCLPIVTDSDTAEIEIPCAGVDFRIQLPILDNEECETWIQVQNVGDEPTVPLLVTWGESGFCPPQAAGPLKSECAGLLRPGSAWSFAESQIPSGSHSAVLYSLSVDPIEIAPNTEVPFASLVCDAVFFNVVGDYLDWVRFDSAYRNRGIFGDFDFGEHPGEPLAAVVNRSCPDPSNPAARVNAAYSGISSDLVGAEDPTFGGYSYYAPLVFADRGSLSSTLRIQNSGILCTSLEIWFKGQDNCIRPILGDVLALAPGETADFDVNTVVGPDWMGTAWVRGTQPLGIIVDTFGPNHFTSYTATASDIYELNLTQGNQVNYAPLIYSEYQGWDTAIQVQNLSGATNAKVKVIFLDRSGDVITTLVDWICPRGSQTYFLPAIAALPGNWVGSARVESQAWWAPGTNQVDPPKLSSVVLLEKWSDPARTTRREAVAYNGQTECLLYDWQVGGGKGGTTSGSAVFAVPFLAKANRGYTSEVAITNLVAKPGFTDFAIFIYDQNGLLDQVCEKLHDRQVEYIDLNTWGSVPPSFLGSMVVSAVFWEHEVFDGRGGFVRNLVGMGGVSVERVGSTLGSQDVPGDESKASEAFPLFDHFHTEDSLPCPGVPSFQPLEAR